MAGTIKYDWNPEEHVNNVERLIQIAGKHVLLNIGLDEAGKPVTTYQNMRQFRPIGVVQNISVGQNKMTQRVFEIGSAKSFISTGPTVAMFSATRALIMGPTLVGILKHGVTHTDPSTFDPKYFIFDISKADFDRPFAFVILFYAPTVTQNIEEDTSSLALLKQGTKEVIGGIVLEGCVISSQNFAINAGDVITFENVTFEAEAVRDLDVSFTPRSVGGQMIDTLPQTSSSTLV